MSKFHVAALRDWDEDRMMAAFDCVTELGTEKQFITRDYKTVPGLVRHRIQTHFLYHSHVWTVFREFDMGTSQFVGLEFNEHDEGLTALASRYMRVRNRLNKNNSRISGIPLGVRV